MKWTRQRQTGFTIVELLIVVVIIAILAAIVVVAYSGLTSRAKDNQRAGDLANIQKLLELYYVDNGGYPMCNATGPNTTPALSNGTVINCLSDELIPKYTNTLPVDPTNSGSYTYRYGAGYKKTGATSFTNVVSDNYILGTKQDGVTSPTYSGWGYSDLTLLVGSNR